MIELENMNSSTSSTTKNARKEWGVVTTSDVDKLSLNSSLFGCEQQNELNKIHSQSDDTLLIGIESSYNLDLLNSFSNKLKNLSNENQAIISTFPTLMAVMESSAAMDSFNDSALSNSDILDEW